MAAATITSKGQITLPKQIRDHLRLAPGDRVDFVIGADGGVGVVRQGRSVMDLYGFLEPRTETSVEAMQQTLLDTAAAEDERIRRSER